MLYSTWREGIHTFRTWALDDYQKHWKERIIFKHTVKKTYVLNQGSGQCNNLHDVWEHGSFCSIKLICRNRTLKGSNMNSIVHRGRLPEADRNFTVQPTETVNISKLQDTIWLPVDKMTSYVFKASKNWDQKSMYKLQQKHHTNQMYSP